MVGLRHCARSWKVVSSIPDGVTGIFYWHNPSRSIMALGSTQPLTELNTGVSTVKLKFRSHEVIQRDVLYLNLVG